MVTELERKLVKHNTKMYEAWAYLWVPNLETNIEEAKQGKWVSELYGKYDCPATVIGAGQSFRKIKDFSPTTVIAVDRISAELEHEYGVTCDFIITDDAQEEVSYYFDDIHNRKVIANLVTHPETIAVLKENGNEIYWHSPMNEYSPFWLWVKKEYGIDGTNSEASTVGYTAVDIAVRLGFKPISLLGLDLCFDSLLDAFTYYSDCPEDKNIGLVKLPDGRATVKAFVHSACMTKELMSRYDITDFSDGLLSSPYFDAPTNSNH